MAKFFLLNIQLLPEITRAMADCQRLEDADDQAFFEQSRANGFLCATSIKSDYPRDLPAILQQQEMVSLNWYSLPIRPDVTKERFWLVSERLHRLLLQAYLGKLFRRVTNDANALLYHAISALPQMELPGAFFFHDDWGYQHIVTGYDEEDAQRRYDASHERPGTYTGAWDSPFYQAQLDRPTTEADIFEQAEQADMLESLRKENAKMVHTLRYILLLTQTENELEAHHHLKVDIPAAIGALVDIPRFSVQSVSDVNFDEIPF